MKHAGGYSDLEMFHEHSDHDVDEYELCHQDEDDEEHRRNDGIDTAVADTVVVGVTVILQCVLSAAAAHASDYKFYLFV